MEDGGWKLEKPLRRIILDSRARTPLTAKVITDEQAALTTIVVSAVAPAPPRRGFGEASARPHRPQDSSFHSPSSILHSPSAGCSANSAPRTSPRLLVEGGGEVNASFLEQRLAHRVVLFFAPKILGGRAARKGVAGDGATGWPQVIGLAQPHWRRLGPDLLLQARLVAHPKRPRQ
jgi:diaminohydroxyphosphoribosylaminopyrimidine deaminase/5-amino-6-(5-phosphoribosylamino)uracil reductase